MRICSKCKAEKDECNFSNSELNKNKGQCKSCKKEYQKHYQLDNRDEILKNKKQYYQDHKDEMGEIKKQYYKKNKSEMVKNFKLYRLRNKDKINEYNKQYYQNNVSEMLEYQRLYRLTHKDEMSEYQRIYRKNRIKLDPIYRLRRAVSSIIFRMLKSQGSSKNGLSIIKFLPYSVEELKTHLESLFEPWMTWNNHGNYNPKTFDENPTWQLDHIIPQSKLPYSSMEDENFKLCWELSNLRPYSSKNNILEGNRR